MTYLTLSGLVGERKEKGQPSIQPGCHSTQTKGTLPDRWRLERTALKPPVGGAVSRLISGSLRRLDAGNIFCPIVMDHTSSRWLIRLSDSWLNLSSFASPHLGSSCGAAGLRGCRAASDRRGQQAAAIWDEQIILNRDGKPPRLI